MIKPDGLYHTKLDYSVIKIYHDIIRTHQEAFPELAEQMRNNPNNATNIYSCFLCLIPLQAKGVLTEETKVKIMKTYKLL